VTANRTYAITIGPLLAAEWVFTRVFFWCLDPVWSWLEGLLQWNCPEPLAQFIIATILASCFLLLSWGLGSRSWASQVASAYWIPPALIHVGFLLYVSHQPAFYKARHLVPFFISCAVSPLGAYLGYRLGQRNLASRTKFQQHECEPNPGVERTDND